MSFFYELLGRVMWRYFLTHLRRRYRRELTTLAGVGVVAVVLGGYVIATRPVKEG